MVGSWFFGRRAPPRAEDLEERGGEVEDVSVMEGALENREVAPSNAIEVHSSQGTSSCVIS
jgi:hypothetical protein